MANPYSGGGNATTGGGGGSWDTTSAVINDYARPTSNANVAGFTSCYFVTDENMKKLRNYLWEFWSGIERYFGKADDAILGNYMLPIAPSTISGTPYKIMLGACNTGATGTVPTNQYVQLDFGSTTVDKFSGTFLDYNQNTQVSLYLPYIGTVPLDTNVVMGKTLNVKYVVDLYTGNLMAHVYVDGSLTYQYEGNCSYNVATSSVNYTETVKGAVTTAASVVATVASVAAALA